MNLELTLLRCCCLGALFECILLSQLFCLHSFWSLSFLSFFGILLAFQTKQLNWVNFLLVNSHFSSEKWKCRLDIQVIELSVERISAYQQNMIYLEENSFKRWIILKMIFFRHWQAMWVYHYTKIERESEQKTFEPNFNNRIAVANKTYNKRNSTTVEFILNCHVLGDVRCSILARNKNM